MRQQVALGPGSAKKPCCAMMKQPENSFSLRINGMPLPGFPISSLADFSAYVTEKFLSEDLQYKVTGQMPGEHTRPIVLKKQQDLDNVLAAGGEVNLIAIHIPIVGPISDD